MDSNGRAKQLALTSISSKCAQRFARSTQVLSVVLIFVRDAWHNAVLWMGYIFVKNVIFCALDTSGAIEFKEFCTKLFKKDIDFDYGSIKDHQVGQTECKCR